MRTVSVKLGALDKEYKYLPLSIFRNSLNDYQIEFYSPNFSMYFKEDHLLKALRSLGYDVQMVPKEEESYRLKCLEEKVDGIYEAMKKLLTFLQSMKW